MSRAQRALAKPAPNVLAGKIPGRATAVSLELRAGLPFAKWADVGRLVAYVEGAALWWLGDWLAYGERQPYGEKYKAAVAATGYEYQTLRNAKAVAAAVEMSRRRDNLTFAHHAEVAALEPDEQDRWLGRAETNKWSRNDLRAEIRTWRRAEAARRAGPLPEGRFAVMELVATTERSEAEMPPAVLTRPEVGGGVLTEEEWADLHVQLGDVFDVLWRYAQNKADWEVMDLDRHRPTPLPAYASPEDQARWERRGRRGEAKRQAARSEAFERARADAQRSFDLVQAYVERIEAALLPGLGCVFGRSRHKPAELVDDAEAHGVGVIAFPLERRPSAEGAASDECPCARPKLLISAEVLSFVRRLAEHVGSEVPAKIPGHKRRLANALVYHLGYPQRYARQFVRVLPLYEAMAKLPTEGLDVRGTELEAEALALEAESP